MEKNLGAESFFKKNKLYPEEMKKLRRVVLSTGLEETLKWGAPVYVYQGKNIVGLGAFKSYFGIWFYQGALLKDSAKKLINAQEGVTRALRQWRFSEGEKIDEKLVKQYILEAIKNAKEGKEIKARVGKPLIIPAELMELFKKRKDVQSVFEKMSLSHRREYADYISEAKKPETREKRMAKIIPMIMKGGGLNDRYR
jgi:uncharacterized protein YdeI (YjbR/CyaY-like superfamily)